MAYRKSSFVPNRETSKTGVVDSNDVLQIVQDNVDTEFEFYEIEEAVVTDVFLNAKDLPIVNTGNKKIPNYSLYGTIKARFLKSQTKSDKISEYIKPMSSHIVVYPVVGEVVNVARYNSEFYYYSPLNLTNNVNMNRLAGANIDGIVKPGLTKYNRMLSSKKGDININGRFGQGIKFGSNDNSKFVPQFPTIKITNGQYKDSRKVNEDGGNMFFPHIQNINLDGSTILISSGELKNKNDILIPAANSSWWPVKWKSSIDGNVIVLNSDSLVLNAKGDKGDVHLIANRTVSLSSNYSITLEAGKNGVINLGEADATNPILKGKETQDLFEKIFVALSEFSNTLKSVNGLAEVNDAAESMLDKFKNIEEVALPKIFSKTVYITDERD